MQTALSSSLALLERIAHETQVTAAGAFEHTTLGTRSCPIDDPSVTQRWLLDVLGADLYSTYYLCTERTDHDVEFAAAHAGMPAMAREDPLLGKALRRANRCKGYSDAGWVVVEPPTPTEPGKVRKGALTLTVSSEEVNAVGAPEPLVKGAVVAVRFPNDRPYGSPGFYMAMATAGPPGKNEPLARWYFHIDATTAPLLLEMITTNLDKLDIRFMTKFLNRPSEYTRPDSGVLYVPRSDASATAVVVTEARERLVGGFRERVPAFTRMVRPGLAIADEPVQSARRLSFGQHRCRVVAEGLRNAWQAGAHSSDDRLAYVVESFATYELDVERPHLNPGAPEFELTEDWS